MEKPIARKQVLTSVHGVTLLTLGTIGFGFAFEDLRVHVPANLWNAIPPLPECFTAYG